jgi:hypothetical protein
MNDILRRVGVRAAACVLLPAVLSASPVSSPRRPEPGQTPVYPSQARAEFDQRMDDYAGLHKKLEATLPELPAQPSPKQIVDREHDMARLLQKARINAKRGDICTKAVRALIRRDLAVAFNAPGGKQLRQSLLDEFTAGVRLEINAPYPQSTPLSSMPAQVLSALPRLPDVLEWRFVGVRLVLLDSQAHIIVDWMENVFP